MSSSSPLEEFNLQGDKKKMMTFLEDALLLREPNCGSATNNLCDPGRGLPWELDNEVYVVCELQWHKMLFHLIGILDKWILKGTAHKISWGK